MSHFLVITTAKPGHYLAYGLVIDRLLSASLSGLESKVVPKASFREWILAENLILVDGDGEHLLQFFTILLRSFLLRPTFLLSVRTEDLINTSVRSSVKRILMWTFRNFPRIRVISIHRNAHEQQLKRYVSDFIYDIQFWDRPYVMGSSEIPQELIALNNVDKICIVPGGLNYKRDPNELQSVAQASPDIKFVIAGKSDLGALNLLHNLENVIVINRYISDGELEWLYERATYVWAIYPNSVLRPSGVFGRAMQYGRIVLVRQGGFLHTTYPNYPRSMAIADFNKNIGETSVVETENAAATFDDSQLLFNTLTKYL